MKLRKFLSAACAVTLLLGVAAAPEVAGEIKLAVTASAASSSVAIDKAHFPDSFFREFVKNNFDKNSNGYLSAAEIKAIKSVDCSYIYNSDPFEMLSSIKGIEYFTELEYLDCSSNDISSLDLSKNTKLTYLNCIGNFKLASLDLSKNTKLKTLHCSQTRLMHIDLSKNTELTEINIANTQLGDVDLSKNTKLVKVTATRSGLTSLNISKCTKLETLECEYNANLPKLDISNCPKLIKAYKEHTNKLEPGMYGISYEYSKSGKNYCFIVTPETKVIAIPKLTAKSTFTCTSSAIRINWNKLSGVTGYKIFRYDDANKKWVAVKAVYDPNATNYKISGLKSGKVYKFRVKAFVKENNKFYFGESCSTISTATRPNTTTVTKANKTSSAVRLFWKNTTCSGYRILRYDSAKKKWVRVNAVGSSSTTQYKISGLKKNTTYKFKVQPYVKIGGKVIDGAASAVFTVKTSK